MRELVTLLSDLEADEDVRVMVLESADPEYFVAHVDLTKVAEYTAEAAKAGGPEDASLGMLWHKLSELPVVTIAKLRGRARGAGSELALACDMRFAARENAILETSTAVDQLLRARWVALQRAEARLAAGKIEALLAHLVILAVIPQATTDPN